MHRLVRELPPWGTDGLARAAKCKALTDEIETAALEIDEYVTAKDGDAAKLKQLQTLLKSLS